ncbi:MAG: hypothetical protein H0X46_10020, partial [Bacteroidetes bacterium]|nr:hypothetical protein [Bacteroidota bacterium]
MKINNIFSVSVVVVAAVMAFNNQANAQAKYFSGYVIMLNGDTLKGELKKNPKREFDNFAKAAYRKKDGGEMKTFSPAKIKEYKVDGVTYVSRNVNGEQVFVKRLSQGTVNLYESQVEVLQMNDLKVKSDYYMEKEAGEFVKIKSGKFKKQVEEVMADNEEILKALA